MRFLICILTTCLAFQFATGQVRPKPQPEDVALAKKLSKTYPKDEFASVSRNVRFTFEIKKDKSGEHVVVSEELTESVLQIKDSPSLTFLQTVGYDSTSTIDDVKFMDKKGHALKTLGYTGSSSYEQNGIFHSDARIYKIAFPSEGQGTYTTYTYTKTYDDIKYFISEYFHDYYPIQDETVIFEIPSWMDIDLLLKNGKDIKKTETAGKEGLKIVTFKASNLAANKSEKNEPGASYYLPHIFFHTKGFKGKDGKQHTIFRTTDDLYAWYHSLAKQIGNDPNKIKPTVESLIKGKTTDQEKIEAIFYWVQDQIRYIAFENGLAGFRPDACQNVFGKKYGDCKGMANLLKEMLVVAGYDARLTWIGTDIIAYDYSIPSLGVDNHMICTLMLNGKKYFLDPTETYVSFGDVAHRIQGRQAMIEDGDKYILERLPEYGKERNKRETVMKFSLKGDQLSGTAEETYDGEGKTYILYAYSRINSSVKEDAVKKLLNRDDKNISVANIKTTDFEDRRGTMKFNYDISISNQVTDLENEKYISLDFDQEFRNLSFDSTRTKDFEYDYKYYNIKRIEFTVPPGYKVTHLPDNIDKSTSNFSLKLTFKQEGNKVIYSKIIALDNAVIPKTDFESWNNAVKSLKEAYGDQIVLKKG
ncbi:MAG TPA: transglutaminase domain-containing protein [Bacteroidia bacterium]|nr:transglutaminase domain-containing protein [Bacteroidia bacterium]